jgi:PAS domain S-box-containing protein
MKRDKILEHKQKNKQRHPAGGTVSAGRGSAEERLCAALLASGTGTFYWDLQTNEVDWDEGMERLFGLAPGCAPTRAGEFVEFIHPEDLQAAQAAHARVRQQGADFDHEYRVIWPDGSVHWLHVHGHVISADQGGTVYMTGACVDVTQRKLADEVLHRYELLARRSRDVILFVQYDDGRILEANAATNAVYGYNSEELKSLTIRDLRAPQTQGLAVDQMQQASAHSIVFETVHRRKDGSVFPVEVSSEGALIGKSRILVSVIRDISERKRVEVQLLAAKELAERSLAQLRATIDSMSEGMFVIYPDRTRPLANPAFFRMYGFDPSSAPDAATKAALLLERYDLNGNLLPFEEWPVSIALRGEAVAQREMIVRRKDTGKEIVTSVNATPVHDSSGNATSRSRTVGFDDRARDQ